MFLCTRFCEACYDNLRLWSWKNLNLSWVKFCAIMVRLVEYRWQPVIVGCLMYHIIFEQSSRYKIYFKFWFIEYVHNIMHGQGCFVVVC